MVALKPPRAVIFDWDNTLVDTWPIIHKALNQTFEKYGFPTWTEHETKQRVKHSLRDSFPKLFGDQWEEVGKDYQHFYQTNHLQQLQTLPLSEEVLKLLKERGVYTVVVSNKKGHNLRREVEHLGWEAYFSKLVGADDAERDKPHPDPVDMALAGSGIEPGADVWFVGDTVVDLECAHNTKCIPVLYGVADTGDREHCDQGTLRRYSGFDVHHHALDHTELLSLFKKVL